MHLHTQSAWETKVSGGRALANRCCYDEAKKKHRLEKEKRLQTQLAQLAGMNGTQE